MNNLFHINEWVSSINHDVCHRRVVEVILNGASGATAKSSGSTDASPESCEASFMIYYMEKSILCTHCQWVFSPALLFLPNPVKLVLIRMSPVSQKRKFQGFLFSFVCFLSSIIISSELKPNNGIIHFLPLCRQSFMLGYLFPVLNYLLSKLSVVDLMVNHSPSFYLMLLKCMSN